MNQISLILSKGTLIRLPEASGGRRELHCGEVKSMESQDKEGQKDKTYVMFWSLIGGSRT
jgi:hypothetical protein